MAQAPRIYRPNIIGAKPERTRAFIQVFVSGRDMTSRFDPVLISCTIIDKTSTMDEAHIECDDAYGKLVLPQPRETMAIALGWQREGMPKVFNGYVTDVEWYYQRKSGRRIKIVGASADLYGLGKKTDEAIWGDGEKEEITLSKVMQDAAQRAGHTIKIDEALGQIKRKQWRQGMESFFDFGLRMARENGAVFKVEQGVASLTKADSDKNADGQAMGHVLARAGRNLLAARIRPITGRPHWKNTGGFWFDFEKAKREIITKAVPGGAGFPNAEADWLSGAPAGDKGAAETQAGSDSVEAMRKRGTGWVTLVGEPGAKARGSITLEGCRSGVDGPYRIAEVEHTYDRSGGFVTRCDVEQPGATITGEGAYTGGNQ